MITDQMIEEYDRKYPMFNAKKKIVQYMADLPEYTAKFTTAEQVYRSYCHACRCGFYQPVS